VRYLSTLSFSGDWLAALGAAVPDVVVQQIPASHPGDVPGDVWAETDVLHTSTVLPDLAAAPRLRRVQLDTSGVDHVVDHPVWASPVDITTIGGVSPLPMAEYVMMMVLTFSHRLPALRTAQQSHEWPTPAERWARYLPRALPGATVGIIGYGRIGREIGRLARAFGMNVVGVCRHPRQPSSPEVDDGIEIVTVGQLDLIVPRCDYIVVTLPRTPETTCLLDAGRLGRLRPGTVLIDVGRGGIVDDEALLDALADGRLAGAALDVFATEPLPEDSPFWDHPAVIVTPHIAGFAPSYERAVFDIVADNLRRFVAGRPLANCVDRIRGY